MGKSFKVRRTIGIDIAYIDELSHIIKNNPKINKTPTTLVSDILSGSFSPLENVLRCGKSKSVSMTEAMRLAIKARADKKLCPASVAANLIISGDDPCLSQDEILIGLEMAAANESKRSSKSIDTSEEYHGGIRYF